MVATDLEFINMVHYFWTERGDPARYTSWDPDRCQRLMPTFYEAWSMSNVYRNLANLACDEAKDGMT